MKEKVTPDVFIYPNNTVVDSGKKLFAGENDKILRKYRIPDVREEDMRFTASDKKLVLAFATFTRAMMAGKRGGKVSAQKKALQKRGRSA